MDNLPTPLNRIELYLGTAAQMPGVTPPEEPIGRLEQYLAFIAGDTSVELPAPASLCEQWLAYVAGITPAEPLKLEGAFHVGVQKVDVRFFAAAAGMPGVVAPEPQNRTEQYWARLADILPVHGVLKYATGTNITLTDVAWWKMGLERINGNSTQQTYTGEQLLTKQGMATPKADSSFWSSISNNVTKTDKEDGWATFGLTSTASFSMFATKAASVDMLAETTYTAIVEVKNCTFTAGTIVLAQTFNSGDSVSTFTVVEGCESSSSNSPTVKLNGTSTAQFNVYVFTTKSTFTNPLRYFFGGSTDLGTADIRATVLAGDHSADWQNYCGNNWQPYVGGVPAPNPNYPQAINTVTGEQTVEIQGKNLLDMSTFTKGGMEHGAWTNTGYRITNIQTPLAVEPSTTYTISVSLSEAVLGFRIGIHQLGADKSFLSDSGWQQIAGNSYSFTTSSNTYYIGVVCSLSTTSTTVSTGTTEDRTTFNTVNEWLRGCSVQLEQGSTATDFQPYQKTKYKINLGKNLFDKNNPNLLVAYIDNEQTTITENGKNRLIWIPCKPNQTYTVQKIATNMEKQVAYTTVEPAIGVTVSGMVSWAANTSSITYTTGADAQFLVVRIWQSDNDVPYTVEQMLASVQIEQGSVATSYAPYFTPIELRKIGTYQDYIYKNDGDWFIHNATAKTVFTSVSLRQYTNNTYNQLDRPYSAVTGYTEDLTATSDMGVGSPDNQTWNSPIVGIFTHAAVTRWWLGFGKVVNDTEAANIMAKGCTVYYALATPTDTKITNQALISQLNALDRAILPQPVAYITASGDLTGELKISYYGEEE